MNLDDLRPTEETRARIKALAEETQAVADLCREELKGYGIDDKTFIDEILPPSPALAQRYSELIIGIAELPADEFVFLQYGAMSSLNDYAVMDAIEGNVSQCLTMLPRSLGTLGHALSVLLKEENDAHLVSRHFYVAAKAFQYHTFTVHLRSEESGVREEVEGMGLTFNPLTLGDLDAFSESRSRLNALFKLLSHDQRAAMNETLSVPEEDVEVSIPHGRIEDLMDVANRNDLSSIAEATGFIVRAAVRDFPHFSGPSYMTFNRLS